MLLEQDKELSFLTTFHVPAVARHFAVVQQVEELPELLQAVNDTQQLLVLGGGSNMLFTKNFDGLVIKNELKGIAVVKEVGDDVYVKAGAGENWHQLVMYCVQRGYGGMENLALIPGNTGASPMQNIGAYGVEIKDIFYELEAYHIEEGRMNVFSNADCQFGYRESVFKRALKNKYIILNVTFKLSKRPVLNTSYGAINQELERMGVATANIEAIAQAVVNIRSSKLPNPAEVGNAGSFFKNPLISTKQFEELKKSFPEIVSFPSGDFVKLAAGWLIEQCGWKGYRKGDAGCYPKQALVLVNYGHATGAEIYDLSLAIIDSVKEKFGVVLEREVNII